jgi:hypothetical protein
MAALIDATNLASPRDSAGAAGDGAGETVEVFVDDFSEETAALGELLFGGAAIAAMMMITTNNPKSPRTVLHTLCLRGQDFRGPDGNGGCTGD